MNPFGDQKGLPANWPGASTLEMRGKEGREQGPHPTASKAHFIPAARDAATPGPGQEEKGSRRSGVPPYFPLILHEKRRRPQGIEEKGREEEWK